MTKTKYVPILKEIADCLKDKIFKDDTLLLRFNKLEDDVFVFKSLPINYKTTIELRYTLEKLANLRVVKEEKKSSKNDITERIDFLELWPRY